MMTGNSAVFGNRFEQAIRVLCPIIDERIKVNMHQDWSEYELRRELASCILGSQVRYEMAQSAVDRIEQAGFFDDIVWSENDHDIEDEIYAILSGSNRLPLHTGSYRFSRLRARQLNKAKNNLLNSDSSLQELVFRPGEAKSLRRELVEMIPGLGPKQASMFIRNVSRSYDLAILDSHVLRFMEIQQLLPNARTSIGNMPVYERAESTIKDYAESLGYPVGYLDWAIWVTMRAAREIRL